MQSKNINEQIRDYCLSMEEAEYSNHQLFCDSLGSFLKKRNWVVQREFETGPFRVLRVRNDEIKVTGAFIDIYATGPNGQTIFIEFDNGNHLKFNSISKLLQADAEFPIGIVHGNRRRGFLRFDNINRILRTAQKLGIKDKVIFLIIIQNKIAERVKV
jgi:hypothetical protein